jgi:phospholipid/cholesterol/gamma-HCH transport system substrate-binding protein
METRANYTIIGLFTVVVVAAVFGFVYWFQGGVGGERGYYRIAFDGSVAGLRTGGAVVYNGIRVGEVTGLELDPKNAGDVLVTVSLYKGVTIRPDTQIGLDYQGLTGIASLSLKGGTEAPVQPGSKSNPPTLKAPLGANADVAQNARDVLRRLDHFIAENQAAFHSAMQNINTFTEVLAKGSGTIDSTLAHIDRFSKVLADNSERLDHIAQGLEDLTGGKDGKGGEINVAARALNALLESVDKRTAEISTGITKLTNAGTKQIDAVSTSFQRTLSTADRVFNNLDKNPSRLLWGGGPPTTGR